MLYRCVVVQFCTCHASRTGYCGRCKTSSCRSRIPWIISDTCVLHQQNLNMSTAIRLILHFLEPATRHLKLVVHVQRTRIAARCTFVKLCDLTLWDKYRQRGQTRKERPIRCAERQQECLAVPWFVPGTVHAFYLEHTHE